jgi:Glycoside-hydrolase family GH114
VFKSMTRSLLISGLYVAVALAAETDSIGQNPSPTVQEVKGAALVAAAPPAAQTGPFGLPSLSDLPGFGWLGSSSGGLFGGRSGNSPQVSSRQLWQPKVGSPFQIILSSAIVLHNGQTQGRTSSSPSAGQIAQTAFPLVPERVDIFDIDLWDNPAETVERLHASGKKVICYFSAGTSEDWRSDFKEFSTQDMGANLPLWKGERWLDIRQRSVWRVMQKRIELASKRGCDAIDPDNIGMSVSLVRLKDILTPVTDGYDNEKGGGFRRPLTKSDAITYIRKLSREAKRYGMSTGLKNSADILKSVRDDVHFAVNEVRSIVVITALSKKAC